MSNTVDGLSIARFRVPDMCCATEEQLIRNRLRSVRGIETMDFDLLQQLLTVGHRLPSQTAISDASRFVETASREPLGIPLT